MMSPQNDRNILKSNFINAVVILMLSSFWTRILGIVWLSDAIYAVSLVAIVLKYFSYPLSKTNQNTIFLLVLTVISMIIGFVETDKVDVDFFLHAGITICVFMCIEMCANRTIQMSEKSKRKILYLFIISGFLLEIYYYFGGLRYAHISEYNMSASLNLANPNEAGMWITCNIIILFGAFFVLKGKGRIAAIGVAVALFPILSATDSRNSLLAAILFIVITVLLRIVRIKNIPKVILLIVAILPIIVFFFYMYIMVPNIDQLQLIIDAGEKGIASREGIWQRVLDDFLNCFWIGDYAKYYDAQMHNSLMTLYCRYGVIYSALAISVIYRALKKSQENLSIYATLGLCGLLFTGCFEGSLFVGVAGLYLMLLVVPVLLGDYHSNSKMLLLGGN